MFDCLKYRRKWTKGPTAVANKIQIILECISKNDDIRRPHQVVFETRLLDTHGTKGFDNVTVGIRSSVVPDHVIVFENRALYFDSVL